MMGRLATGKVDGRSRYAHEPSGNPNVDAIYSAPISVAEVSSTFCTPFVSSPSYTPDINFFPLSLVVAEELRHHEVPSPDGSELHPALGLLHQPLALVGVAELAETEQSLVSGRR